MSITILSVCHQNYGQTVDPQNEIVKKAKTHFFAHNNPVGAAHGHHHNNNHTHNCP